MPGFFDSWEMISKVRVGWQVQKYSESVCTIYLLYIRLICIYIYIYTEIYTKTSTYIYIYISLSEVFEDLHLDGEILINLIKGNKNT